MWSPEAVWILLCSSCLEIGARLCDWLNARLAGNPALVYRLLRVSLCDLGCDVYEIRVTKSFLCIFRNGSAQPQLC